MRVLKFVQNEEQIHCVATLLLLVICTMTVSSREFVGVCRKKILYQIVILIWKIFFTCFVLFVDLILNP